MFWTQGVYLVFVVCCCTCVAGLEHELSDADFKSSRNGLLSKREKLFSSRVVKEYDSYNDMEIFVINVPQLTTEMKVYFHINPRNSVCAQSSIEVYYQYGAPPLPPHQSFQNGTYTVRDWAGNVVLSTDTKTPLSVPFQDAMPGQWYLGVVVPKSNGVKRISEFGFGNFSTEGCSFDVGMNAFLTIVNYTAFLPSDGEAIQDVLFIGQEIRYYHYQHINASSLLIVNIPSCYITSGQDGKRVNVCPLVVSVRARALPIEGVSVAKDCTEHDTCRITVPTPEQKMWDYYITTRRISRFKGYTIHYNLSVSTVGCFISNLARERFLDPGCVPVQEMYSVSTGKVLSRKFNPNQWNTSLTVTHGIPMFFSFKIPMFYVGSMLRIHMKSNSQFINSGKVSICLQKDFAPTFYMLHDFDSQYSLKCTGYLTTVSFQNRSSRIYVPFPATATWYVSVYGIPNRNIYTSLLQFYAEIQACTDDCNNNGPCQIHTKADVVYGSCSCDAGFKGWACNENQDVDLARVLLLTLSNLLFLVDVVIARYKKMFPEMIVYLFMLLMSTMYHLCGSGVVCMMDRSFLQLCDFYAIVLSVWVTLLALTNYPNTPTLNMIAMLALFVGVREAYRSVFPFLITVCFGIVFVVVYNVVLWTQGKPSASFSKKRWALFILPATIMVSMSFVIFAFLETEDNYKYVHSVAHVLLGLGIALLLPNHRESPRESPRAGHYDLTREFDEDTPRELPNSRTPLLANGRTPSLPNAQGAVQIV